MPTPIEALMAEYNVPMTRDNYIQWNNGGKSAKVSPEEEAEMPKRFAYPTVTYASLGEPAKKAPGKGDAKGKAKPAEPEMVKTPLKHFNGKVFKPKDVVAAVQPERTEDIYIGGKAKPGEKVIPNPKNVQPQLDTDNPQQANKYATMDMSNGRRSSMLPPERPEDDLTMHGIERNTRALPQPPKTRLENPQDIGVEPTQPRE